MAAPEPHWRRKTRPCPFYSQGRCLFSDSCNFLHSVKINKTPTACPDENAYSGSVTTTSYDESDRRTNGSDGIVESPNNTPSVAKSPQSVRSPPRSPRLSGLLFALRSVIGPDEEVEDVREEFNSVHNPGTEAEVLRGNVSDCTFRTLSPRQLGHQTFNIVDTEHHLQPESDAHSNALKLLETPNTPSDAYVVASDDLTGLSAPSDILTPPFPLSSQELPASSIPHPHSPFHSKMAKCREASFDSGYADGRISPANPTLSPPRSSGPNATFDLLSSPFLAPLPRVLSPRFSAVGGPPSPIFNMLGMTTPQLAKASPPLSPRRPTSLDYDLDSPSDRNRTVEEEWDQGTSPSPSIDSLATERPRLRDIIKSPTTPDSFRQSVQVDLTITSNTEDTGSDHGPTSTGLDIASHELETKSEMIMSPTQSNSLIENVPLDSNDVSNKRDSSELKSISPSSPAMHLKHSSPADENDDLGSVFGYYSEPSAYSTATNSLVSLGTLVDSKLPTSDSKYEQKEDTTPESGHEPISVSPSSSSPSPNNSDQSPPSSPVNAEESRSLISANNRDGTDSSTKVPFGFRRPFVLGQSSASSLMKNRVSRERPVKRPSVVTAFPHQVQDNLSTDSASTNSPSGPQTPSWMRPLRLSRLLNSPTRSASPQSHSNNHRSHLTNISDFMQAAPTSAPHSPSVSSDQSFLDNRLLSSARSSLIPEHIRNTLIPAHDISPLLLASDHAQSFLLESVLRLSPTGFHLEEDQCSKDVYDSRSSGLLSPLSAPLFGFNHDDEDEADGQLFVPAKEAHAAPRTAPVTRPPSILHSPIHAIAIPPPTLLFAIASDDVSEVKRVLESGVAGPNDQVGPQSALEFTLTNDQLKHKVDIVKVLLAHGADPSSLQKPEFNPRRQSVQLEGVSAERPEQAEGDMNPAIKYYLARANAPHVRQTATLIHGSFFRPLGRIRYDLIGQDRALEQLYRVLSMHSQQSMVNPLVVLCCGPSGHGKSLLARKFGYLLDVPTHTVNMTTLQSTHDLWQSHSMSPYEEPSTLTLAEFLMENEGRRCVVVLDEIEKCENERNLWSLLAPWELGRCSIDAGRRHIDVRNVIWIGTSNIGQDLVFEYHASRGEPQTTMSREEYIELMRKLRPRVSTYLGASLLSRVTTVLPFVPFTLDEKMAIATEAALSLGGDMVAAMDAKGLASIAESAMTEYVPAEGARSLHRAVSTQLLDSG